MKSHVVATLGPSSRDESVWSEMLAAGADGFRLNTSHLSLTDLDGWLERLTGFLEGREDVPLVLDLQGSKWRLGEFQPFSLEPGDKVRMVYGHISPEERVLPVPHLDFFSAASGSSGEIRIDDAKILLCIQDAEPGQSTAVVERGGIVRARKGITCTDSDYRVERINEKDRAVVERTHAVPGICYAISYLRDAAEMKRYRSLFGTGSTLIAKLERATAVQEAQEIALHADELWVCRGDLGAETGLQEMAGLVAAINGKVRNRELNRPVLMAGQVLEHLTLHATPTRSEVCYLHDVLAHGYAGVVLSDETATGHYPIEACRVAAMFN